MSRGPSDDASRSPHGTVIDVAVLSERRAQRAEAAEEALAARAAAAERAVVSMEKRLSEAEARLAEVQAERDRLAADRAAVDRQLIDARQKEFAEQQVRLEVEEDLAVIQRAAEEEIADLRARLATAEHAVVRLEAEVAHEREQTAAAEARAGEELEAAAAVTAEQQALDERLHALNHRMAVLREEISRTHAALERRLLAEIAARETAEAWVEAHRAGAKAATAIEHGEAARLIAAERERAAAMVAIQRRRADEEAEARRAAERALAQLRGEPVPGEPAEAADPRAGGSSMPPVAPAPSVDPRAAAVQAEIARLQALRTEATPAARIQPADLVLDLGRAADRLRAQAAEAAPEAEAKRPRRAWWRRSWWRARRAGGDLRD